MKAFDNKTLDMYNHSLELVEVQLKAEIFFLRIYAILRPTSWRQYIC